MSDNRSRSDSIENSMESYEKTDHDHLIECMREIGLSNHRGVCRGVVFMWMQAFLTRDVPTFTRRLQKINLIPVEKFKDKITALKNKQAAIAQQTREHLGSLRKVPFKEKINLKENNPTLNFSISALLKQEDINQEERERRLNSLFWNAFVQQQITSNMQDPNILDPAELEQMDILPFLEGVELHQLLQSKGVNFLLDIQTYLETESTQVKSHFLKYNQLVASMILTLELEKKQENISLCDSFIGAYTKEQGFFEELDLLLENKKLDDPIAFIFVNGNHTIGIGYDPVLKSWSFFDISRDVDNADFNKLDPRLLLNNLVEALSENDFAVFLTSSFTLTSQAKKIESLLKDWKKDNGLSEISLESLIFTDSNGIALLHLAALCGEENIVVELIKNGDDINKVTNQNATALFIAAQQGNLDTVQALLSHGADPSIPFRTTLDDLKLFLQEYRYNFDDIKPILSIDNNTQDISVKPVQVAMIMGHASIVDLINAIDFAKEAPKNNQVNLGNTHLAAKLFKSLHSQDQPQLKENFISPYPNKNK